VHAAPTQNWSAMQPESTVVLYGDKLPELRYYYCMLRFLDPPYTVGCLFWFKDKNCRSHVRREVSWVGRGVVDLWQALSTSTSYCALTFSRGPPVLAMQPSGRNWVVIGGEKEERGGVAGWRCCCLLLSRQGIKAPRHQSLSPMSLLDPNGGRGKA
jgi:hypothetical protein